MNIENTVAFNKTPIDKLNKKAQSIDKRLFLFAYYNPNPFPKNENAIVQFYTAVINLYGLFWDCGSFVRTFLLHKRQSDSLLERDEQGTLTQKGSDIYNRFSSFTLSLSGLRNAACHNNAKEFYYNRQNDIKANDFFSSIGLNSGTLSIDEWQKCVSELCKEGDNVINDIEYCLNWLNSCSQSEKDKIIRAWLNDGICPWYINRQSEMNGYLEELQIYYCFTFRKRPQTLSRWLQYNLNANDCSRWLNQQSLSILLNDAAQCPKPAFPIDVFKALTKDVYKFATTGIY